MQSKETVSGNKIISEYEGRVIIPDLHEKGNPNQYHLRELKYRESWDWLMPVWSKLINDSINNRLEGEGTSKKYNDMLKSDWHQICMQGLSTATLNLFWTGIIEGVKWVKNRK